MTIYLLIIIKLLSRRNAFYLKKPAIFMKIAPIMLISFTSTRRNAFYLKKPAIFMNYYQGATRFT